MRLYHTVHMQFYCSCTCSGVQFLLFLLQLSASTSAFQVTTILVNIDSGTSRNPQKVYPSMPLERLVGKLDK